MLSNRKGHHLLVLPKICLWYLSIVILVLLVPYVSASRAHSVAGSRKQSHVENQFLYVLAGQEILAYHISRDGTLKRIPFTSPYLGRQPGFLATSPGGKSLYACGIDDEYRTPSGYVSRFSISRNGILSGQKGAPAGEEPVAVAFGNSGRSVYLVSGGLLLSFRISSAGSFVQAALPIQVGRSAFLVASPDGHFLWVAQTKKTMTLYRILAGGTLSRIGGFRLTGQPAQIAWNPNGKFVSVVCSGMGTVTEIAIKGGKPVVLGSKQITAGLTQSHLTVVSGGQYLLIGDTAKHRIGAISVRPNGNFAGSVKWHHCPYPFAIMLNGDKRFAYMLDPEDNLIAQFSIENGNNLSPLKPAFVQTANNPVSFTIAGPGQP